MFKTLLLKEIHESILNFRFLLVSVLCLFLIPFGLYIASMDYKSKVEEYNQEQAMITKSKENPNFNFKATGLFPPSPLSIISGGLKDYLPYAAKTSFEGMATTEKKLQNNNLQSALLGKIDFVFVIINFMSLLALIFTFGSITSEKEQGTLKIILANQVNRWKVIVAKIIGNYLVFITPFVVSIIVGILVIQFITGVNLIALKYLAPFSMMMLFTLIFLFLFFCMGIWISVISKSTLTSIIILLFIWVFAAFGIPSISPMNTQIIDPVKTEANYIKEYEALREQIIKEQREERKVLFEKLVTENNIDDGNDNFNYDEAEKKIGFIDKVKPINDKYAQKLNLELGKFEKNHQQALDHQLVVTSNLARISPVSSYVFLISELSGTSLSEKMNRADAAQKYQYSVNQNFYNKYEYKEYAYKGGSGFSTSRKKDFKDEKLKIPDMVEYASIPLSALFKKIWPDMVLLIWYSLFFLIGAIASFLRFDVR